MRAQPRSARSASKRARVAPCCSRSNSEPDDADRDRLNNVQGMFFAKLAAGAAGIDGGPVAGGGEAPGGRVLPLPGPAARQNEYVAGPDFTCADVMVMFNLTSLSRFGGRTIDDLPNVVSYVGRITQRPAYLEAMRIAGPAATKPKA